VEYKRGRPKPERVDEVQLCAQALCLEEMLSVGIERGALFYGKPRRRTEVALDIALRAETEALAARMHALFQEGRTPKAQEEPKCRSCSLYECCRPDVTSRRTVARYLEREVFTPET
jgi:CRISPR-associated exonuclease Cas4